MLIDPKNNLFQAMQNVAQGLNVDKFVQSISENAKASLGAAHFVDSMAISSTSPLMRSGVMSVSGYGDMPPVDMGVAFLETAGAVVVGVGGAIGKGIDTAFADFKNDGKMEKFGPDGKSNSGTESNVYVLNGVDQNEKSRNGQAEDTAKTLGKDVNMIHNATGGLFIDGIEYLKETFLGMPSPASEKLSDELYKKLTKKPPENVEVVAYSQGSTQATMALSMTVARMKKDGMTDEQIRDVMRDHVDVTMVGTPVDPNNPMQLIWNVPPGLAGIGQKRLDWYFQEQDILLHGGSPPHSDTKTTEPGGEPNFKMIRHEKDPVANWVRTVGPADAAVLGGSLLLAGPFALFNPVTSTYIGVRLVDLGSKLFVNHMEQGSVFGYHDYNVYYSYMRDGVADEPSGQPRPQAPA
jgi:hypothetical protein